jgi:hypothetical protein
MLNYSGKEMGARFSDKQPLQDFTISESTKPKLRREEYEFAGPASNLSVLSIVEWNSLRAQFNAIFGVGNSLSTDRKVRKYNSLYCEEKLRKIGSYFAVKDTSSNKIFFCLLLDIFVVNGNKQKWLKVVLHDLSTGIVVDGIFSLTRGVITYFPVTEQYLFIFGIHMTKLVSSCEKLFLNHWFQRSVEGRK